MKNAVATLTFVGFALGTAACTVGFSDAGATKKFPCESDSDCVEGQICTDNVEGVDQPVCANEQAQSGCKDEDNDGRGVGENRSNCPACKQGLPGGCRVDCNDDPAQNGAQIFPGQYERCNGRDDNCDGKTEAETGVGSVACGKQECDNTQAITSCDPNQGASGSCPLEDTPEQSGTTWGCATIDGTPTCIAKGSFTRGKQECTQPSGYGKCEGGEWTQVPSKCTMP